jgi:hypothetical protein
LAFSSVAEFDLPVDVSRKLSELDWNLQFGGERFLRVGAFDIGEDFVDFVYGRTEFSGKTYADVFSNVRNSCIQHGGPDGGKSPFFAYAFGARDVDGLIEFKPRIELPVPSVGACAVYSARAKDKVYATDSYLIFPGSIFDLGVASGQLSFEWAGRGVRRKTLLTKIVERWRK